MKKYILFIVVCYFNFLSAQTKSDVTAAIKDVENSKSGNFNDVFAGFYQAAFKSISKDGKALEFNSTLFSLVKSSDKDILLTRSRSGISFLRNFQINAKANLDSNFDFTGYGGGIKWSPLNERDNEFVNLTGTQYHQLSNDLEDLAQTALRSAVAAELIANPNADVVALSDELTDIVSAILSGHMNTVATLPHYIGFVNNLDSLIALSSFASKQNAAGNNLTTTVLVADYLKGMYDDFYKNLDKNPLLTFSGEGNADKKGKFNNANFGVVFLKGNGLGELDLRAKFSYADTTAVNTPRTSFNAKAGWNFKILQNVKNKKSVFELKFYGEYNKIFRNALPDEEEEKILANADIRLRITDELWLPFTVKYDTKNSNFLGFLNVTYNFGDD